MAGIISSFNNIALSGAGSLYTSASSYAFSQMNSGLRRMLYGDTKDPLRFYYKNDQRGFFRTMVNSALQQVAQQAINEVVGYGTKKLKEAVNKMLKKGTKSSVTSLLGKDESGDDAFLSMKAGGHTIVCHDYEGYPCKDGLITKIPTKKPVEYNSEYSYKITSDSSGKTKATVKNSGGFTVNYLVWQDPSAIVNVNSSKNLVLTRVVGRDYSRKELISNGDIEIQVSGHILSDFECKDEYPYNRVQQFIQTMQYKGVIDVNNVVLKQFNITQMVIKDFNLPSSEGSIAKQDYSFTAVGIQPTSEVEVTQDTLKVIDITTASTTTNSKTNKWTEFIKQKAEGVTASLSDSVTSASSGIGSLIKI